jgi:hypothetical protein
MMFTLELMLTQGGTTIGSFSQWKLHGILIESNKYKDYALYKKDEIADAKSIRVKFNICKAFDIKNMRICYKGKCQLLKQEIVGKDKWQRGGENITLVTENIPYNSFLC